jgi:hypothetical protein
LPEDLPKAVMILLWLLSGTIIFGYLLMDFELSHAFGFIAVFFGLPVAWHFARRGKQAP